jgi:hypothetical protein
MFHEVGMARLLTSSLRIGEFPSRLLRTKNHRFAALRFPDFQRWM